MKEILINLILLLTPLVFGVYTGQAVGQSLHSDNLPFFALVGAGLGLLISILLLILRRWTVSRHHPS